MSDPAKKIDPGEGLVQLGVPCQLEAFPAELQGGPPSREEPWGTYVQRRFLYLRVKIDKKVRKLLGREPEPVPAREFPAPELKAGDVVRVRSAEYINATLDEKFMYRGCSFGAGMYRYCGQELKVLRVVNRFFDEGRSRMLKARHMVLLDGVHCDGSNTPETEGCDRMCYFFWRTEWLEKVESPADQRRNQ